MYLIGIDYEDYKPSTYNGVFIDKYENEKSERIIKINTGSPEKDINKALKKFVKMTGETTIYTMSSYDDYFMDLDYENDPEYRAEVDAVRKEMEEKGL